MDRERAIKAVEELLLAMGEDINREGIKETPRRVADMFAELTSGNSQSAAEHLSKTFSVSSGEMVIEKDIAFSSTCEHHLMPFFGKIAIAYIPNEKVVGLSKLARTVEVYAKRLQLQEQLTNQIANAVMESLAPKGVMVVCEAEHTCMTCRGVKKPGSKTVTYCVLGDFSQQRKTEVLSLLK
ncbi:MAG: GTP cyclohydrolase I FolE [Clostridiales bacterium]|nr:GTP cyclohydrolase I FolE [Clostridiales bacterium]